MQLFSNELAIALEFLPSRQTSIVPISGWRKQPKTFCAAVSPQNFVWTFPSWRSGLRSRDSWIAVSMAMLALPAYPTFMICVTIAIHWQGFIAIVAHMQGFFTIDVLKQGFFDALQ